MNQKYLKNIELDKIINMAIEKAVCPEAKERLRNQLPFTRTEDVRELLMQTDTIASHLLKNGNPRIASCQGADAAVRRAEKGGVLSMAELLFVAQALRNFAALQSWFAHDESAWAAVNDLFYSLTPQPGLQRDINDSILSESEMADSASGELAQIRRKIRNTEGAIREKLDGIIKNPNSNKQLQDPIISLRNGRFVVPVKAEHRNEFAGVIHDVSSSGSTLFVEPTAVVEANAKIFQLRSQEQQEIERILGEFSGRVAAEAPMFAASYDAMLEIDMRIAKAELGLSMNGVKPIVNDELCFNLMKARHPLLDKTEVVPVDIELGIKYDVLVITGPNTGGKTVALKTAGLLCAMAQLGYLLPVHDSSSVCVFEQILVDIGDEQSIEQSLSTFSGHIRNITGILQVVNNRSLVLLDELGAGTDPAEGAALAVSIIEHLRGSGALIMATTHYAEMKMFALDTEGVQNAGSEFDVETLRPTYRLIVGVPGRSNAFLISEKLGVPQIVINRAREHMSTEQRRFETVLTQLEDAKLELHVQQDEIEKLRYTATHQLEIAKEQRDALIKQGEEELDAARHKAKELSDEVQNTAFLLMDEMKRIEKDERLATAQKARRAREIARKDSENLYIKSSEGQQAHKRKFVPLKQVQVGQEVWIPEMDKLAIVITMPDKAALVEVRMGAIKTKFPLIELSAPQKTEKVKLAKRSGTTLKKANEVGARTSKMEINLLGKNVDEALLETDQFIDDSVMQGLNPIHVIHGRGTGVLRKAIHQHLRRHPSVKSFRLGQYGEGEDGVTVLELK